MQLLGQKDNALTSEQELGLLGIAGRSRRSAQSAHSPVTDAIEEDGMISKKVTRATPTLVLPDVAKTPSLTHLRMLIQSAFVVGQVIALVWARGSRQEHSAHSRYFPMQNRLKISPRRSSDE